MSKYLTLDLNDNKKYQLNLSDIEEIRRMSKRHRNILNKNLKNSSADMFRSFGIVQILLGTERFCGEYQKQDEVVKKMYQNFLNERPEDDRRKFFHVYNKKFEEAFKEVYKKAFKTYSPFYI